MEDQHRLQKRSVKNRDAKGYPHLRGNEYITANLTFDQLRKPFTVGDGKTYGGYHNAPLIPGTTYVISYAAVDINDVSSTLV